MVKRRPVVGEVVAGTLPPGVFKQARLEGGSVDGRTLVVAPSMLDSTRPPATITYEPTGEVYGYRYRDPAGVHVYALEGS